VLKQTLIQRSRLLLFRIIEYVISCYRRGEPPCHLLQLPGPLLGQLVSYLPAEERVRLAATCRRLHTIVWQPDLWRCIRYTFGCSFLKQFGSGSRRIRNFLWLVGFGSRIVFPLSALPHHKLSVLAFFNLKMNMLFLNCSHTSNEKRQAVPLVMQPDPTVPGVRKK
jgi:hypothetical protein